MSARRAGRAGLLLAAALSPACSDQIVGTLPAPVGGHDAGAAGGARRTLAVLFVVDEGLSPTSVQGAVAREFVPFMTALVGGDTPIVRIGVVGTAMDGVPGCASAGGRLRQGSDDFACSGNMLVADQTTGPIDFRRLSESFTCLMRLPGSTCGEVRQPLAAALAALSADVNPGFGGDDIVVVIATTEDDCSLPPMTDLFEETPAAAARYGRMDKYRCHVAGDVCDRGARPPIDSPAADVPLTGCHADAAAALSPLERFVGALQGKTALASKVQAGRLAVAVLAGPTEPYVVTTGPALASTCSGGASGYTGPPVRLRDFAAAFGARAAVDFACGDDVHPRLAPLGAQLRTAMGGSFAAGPVAP